MFERYTEKARRVIFFARYEASQFGSPYIETEHLLLGLLREDKALTNRFLRSHASVESIRKQIEGHTTVREDVSTSVDLPLSNESKRVLAYAAEEAERLSHKHIGTEHLLLGLLREEKCFAAEILHERGLRLNTIREEVARTPHEVGPVSSPRVKSFVLEFSYDLSAAAASGELDSATCRDQEFATLIEVLGGDARNNPVLVGERGVGKTALVETLAHRISHRSVPPFLTDKRVLALDVSSLTAWTRYHGQSEERLQRLLRELVESRASILFVQDLYLPVGAGAAKASIDMMNILGPYISRSKLQCIWETTPADYETVIEKIGWFANLSRPLRVSPVVESDALKVLQAVKGRHEQYHAVSYSDAALEFAARHSKGYLGRAVGLLDEAGARVKARQSPLPEDVVEIKKRIAFILQRMENAIANHEFEKARFYSDEERKERERLRELFTKHRIDPSPIAVVQPGDMQAIIAS